MKLKRAWGSDSMDCSSSESERTLSCPQSRIQFLDTPSNKRTKTTGQSESPVRSPFRPESPFLSIPSPNQDILDNIESFVPPHKRPRKIQQQDQDHFLGVPQKNPAKEKIFSIEDVKGILERTLREQETRLREEYDKVLVERLQEQFAVFSKFNEDYISRQMQSSDYNTMYIS